MSNNIDVLNSLCNDISHKPCICRHREYEDLQQERAARRRPRPPPLPEFFSWVHDQVKARIDRGDTVDVDLALMCDLPSRNAEEYPAMWAYGNHYRCLPEEESTTHETFDSGVFVMSPQGCRASAQDTNIVEADLPYIGILKKIVVVTYITLRMTVMKCSWIRPNLGRNPTVRQDDHGFWMVKSGARQDPHRENPYVFPYSVSQVSNFHILGSYNVAFHFMLTCTSNNIPFAQCILLNCTCRDLHTSIM